MTKKHFIEIARMLKDERDACEANLNDGDPRAFNPVDRVIGRLADTFATINPNFDRRRFFEACGIREE